MNKLSRLSRLIIYGVICGILAFFTPRYGSVLLSIVVLLLIAFKIICEQNSISNIKEYIKDNTAKGYHLIFKLINNNDISFSTTIEEFNKIKGWYEDNDKASYSIKEWYEDNNSPTTITSGKYLNLNKVNIVEFSYSTITNKKNILNPIRYILTSPAPKIINVFNYVKGLFLAPLILAAYIIYEKYILNVEMKNILSNTTMLNHILNTSINFITIMFLFYYIIFFILKILGMSKQDTDYIYEVENQRKNKVYNYAILNFVIIVFLAHSLLSVNLL